MPESPAIATIRRKLIEVSIPLEAINKASAREKSIRHGHPSTLHLWWARRPLAACRAVLFAQLVDDPSAWPDRFPTAAAQEAERKRLHGVIERLVPWEASNNETILQEARHEIARSVAWGRGEEPPAAEDGPATLRYLQEKAPPVYDPFSGGGSIPLEAQRLGLRAYGSDLNPVAVLIGKALVEIPPKFAGRAPVNPEARARLAQAGAGWTGRGAQGLAEDARYYGRWMRDEAARRIGHLYPKAKLPDGGEATVIAWLWARTVRSPDPAAKGTAVPLVSSFMLSTKEGRKAWAEVVIDDAAHDGWRFEVRTGALAKADEERLKKGTIGRSDGGTCALTGTSMPFTYVRAEGQTRGLGVRLMAVVAEGNRTRLYLSPTAEQEAIALRAKPAWVPEGDLPNNPRDFKTPNYGMTTFASLFTARQLVALTTFSDLVTEARDRALADAREAGLPGGATPLHADGRGAVAYADAIATYLGCLVSRTTNYSSTLCVWSSHAKDELAKQVFLRQALAMSWDFAETNAFGNSGGSISNSIEWLGRAIEFLAANGEASVSQRNAAANSYPSPVVISTDPPYFDNVGYADLSDFFYVWLRKALSSVWPSLFRRLAVPKDEELVATPYRHGGQPAADTFFMDGMSRALDAMRQTTTDALPLTIFYAFKQSDNSEEGTTSSGWATFLQGVVDSALVIDGTWPLRTELIGNLKLRTNSLASSIVLVCRKRAATATTITRAAFMRALRRELPDAVAAIRRAGVGPVDMQQSVIGPGMGVFTRHASVLEDDDSRMTVRTALSLINRAWDEIENEATEALDAPTQVAVAWFASFGMEQRPAGDLITLANAKNVATQTLFDGRVFHDGRGRAALLPREALPADWSPAEDRATAWRCVQHAIRVLNAPDGGAEAAAAIIAAMGPRAEAVLGLAHRLFQIATDRGWASEALAYNQLAEEWPRLLDLAPRTAARGPAAERQAQFAL